MRINQLEYLVAIKQYGSISQAAQALYISQSAISKAIKELEDELGVVLLKRTKKGSVFTPQGEAVLASAARISRELEQIQTVKYETADAFGGRVRLGAGSHFCAGILTEVMADIQRDHPLVAFDVFRSYSKALLRDVQREAIDLALIQVNSFDQADMDLEIKRQNLVFEALYTSRLTFVAAKNHPLLQQKRVRLEDVTPYSIVTIRRGLDEFTQRQLKKHGYTREAVCIEDVLCSRKYAEERLALEIIPADEVARGNADYRLQLEALDVEGFENTMVTGLAYRQGAGMPLLDFCMRQIRQYFNQ